MDVPRPETIQHRDTQDWSSVLSTPHWTVQFSEATWSSTTAFIISSQEKHWSKTAWHTGPLQTSTNPQPMWSVHGCLQYATAIVTTPKQAPHRLGQSSARKESTDSGGSEAKCRKRKEKPKSLEAAATRVPRQKTIACYARENAASNSRLKGSWKTQSAHRTPDLSFLPSVAASCVGLFLFFEISKLEDFAIKLVEIGSEKHKFPNFFLLKRVNFVFKKHWCLLYG
jgi:hypothetical protein